MAWPGLSVRSGVGVGVAGGVGGADVVVGVAAGVKGALAGASMVNF